MTETGPGPKRTRKANLESWVSQVPNDRGYYEAKVWMGIKPDGKPDRRHLQRKSLPQLRKAVRVLENRRDAGQGGKPGKLPTVEEMLTRHLAVVLPAKGRAPRTISDYWSKCRNDIFPRWGGCRIDRLLPEWLEDGYADMLAAGHAPSHVVKVHVILSSAYKVQAERSQKYGLAGGTVIVNPCDYVDPPELSATEKKSLTKRQARAVLAQAEKSGNWLRWAYGMSVGNRQGEVLGLRWEYMNIDVPEGEPGEARISWQLQRLTWEHGCADETEKALRKKGAAKAETDKAAAKRRHECAAKHCKKKPCPARCKKHTRACPSPCPDDCESHARDCPDRKLPQGCVPVSGALVLREIKEKRRARVKTVPIPPELCAPFREHREKQFEAKMLAGSEWTEHDLVFTRWNGSPVDPRQDWEEWKRLQEASGVAHRGVHGTRHTAATLAVDEGVAITVVKEMLGHSDIRVTEGYIETASPQAQRAARTIGKALFGRDSGT
jgi:integrase